MIVGMSPPIMVATVLWGKFDPRRGFRYRRNEGGSSFEELGYGCVGANASPVIYLARLDA
jgi:hypothetical protein